MTNGRTSDLFYSKISITLTNEEILALREEPLQVCLNTCTLYNVQSSSDLVLQINLPSNTVAVESGVKMVTRAALVCTDRDEQDGFSLQCIAARSKNPFYKKKK